MKSIIIILLFATLILGGSLVGSDAASMILTESNSAVYYSGVTNNFIDISHHFTEFNSSTDIIADAYLSFTIFDDETNEQFVNGDLTQIYMNTPSDHYLCYIGNLESGVYNVSLYPDAPWWQSFDGEVSYTFDKTEGLYWLAGAGYVGAWSIMDITTTLVIERVSPVPEPATIILFATGLTGFAWIRIRRRARA